MGQYYRPTIITHDGRVMTLYAHEFNNGSKLTEHSWIGNNLVNAVLSLIYQSRKRLAWIGDYACNDYEGSKELYAKALPFPDFQQYYNAAWADNSDADIPAAYFSDKDKSILLMDCPHGYLINHDSREFIDIASYIGNSAIKMDGELWCLNPLPLLTACGNGRGGGDFEGIGNDNTGKWAFATLEYADTPPNEYGEVHFVFIEGREA